MKTLSSAQLEEWRAEADEHTLFVFDVRQPEEYESGHLPGARHAPGGQLVQATDIFLAVRNARVVLVDDCGVRATMTASWLNQMGMPQVYVLEPGWEQGELEAGAEPVTVLGGVPKIDWVDPAGLAADSEAVVVDVARSSTYRAGHVPGAFWGARGSISRWLQTVPTSPHYVVSAEQDAMTALCVAVLARHTEARISGLRGGYGAWCKAGSCHRVGSGDGL